MSKTYSEVERGFVIVRSNGRPVDSHLYRSEKDAAFVVAFLSGYKTVPARRVSSFRKSGGTTLALRSEIVLEPQH